jgi:hypothetical protein
MDDSARRTNTRQKGTGRLQAQRNITMDNKTQVSPGTPARMLINIKILCER